MAISGDKGHTGPVTSLMSLSFYIRALTFGFDWWPITGPVRLSSNDYCQSWQKSIAWIVSWTPTPLQQTVKHGLQFLWCDKWPIAGLNSAALCNCTADCVIVTSHSCTYASRNLFTKNIQGCHISREMCLFPRWREILGNIRKYWEIQEIPGTTRKYKS